MTGTTRDTSRDTSKPRLIATALLANTAMGCIPAALALLFSNPGLPVVGRAAFDGAVYANSIGLLAWWAMPKVLCRLQAASQAARLAAVVITLSVCGLVGCLAANFLLVGLGLVPIAHLWDTFRITAKICLLITLGFGILTTLFSTLEARLRSTTDALREKEFAEERAQKMAAEARFASLESRVHPHFLFNTLNSISALVREDPVQAERMIERLSALIRFSLDSELAGLVPLSEEFRVTRDYLEIEKVRFGDRLRFSIEAGAGTDGRQVPPLSVQTLVENAVKYAVGTRREGAEIVVRSRMVAGELRVEVSDDGPGFDPAASLKPGHGLDLLRRRLAALFGSAASLDMYSEGGRMSILITVAA